MPDLNEKHRDVFDRLLIGRSRKDIARELGISTSSVNQRILAVREWYGGVSSRDALVRYAHDVNSDRPPAKLTVTIAALIAGARAPEPGDPTARYSFQRKIALLILAFGTIMVMLQIACLILHG